MTRWEILGEIEKLEQTERILLAESVLELVRRDIQSEKKLQAKPFTFKTLEMPAYTPDFTFSREDIYDDDGR